MHGHGDMLNPWCCFLFLFFVVYQLPSTAVVYKYTPRLPSIFLGRERELLAHESCNGAVVFFVCVWYYSLSRLFCFERCLALWQRAWSEPLYWYHSIKIVWYHQIYRSKSTTSYIILSVFWSYPVRGLERHGKMKRVRYWWLPSHGPQGCTEIPETKSRLSLVNWAPKYWTACTSSFTAVSIELNSSCLRPLPVLRDTLMRAHFFPCPMLLYTVALVTVESTRSVFRLFWATIVSA